MTDTWASLRANVALNLHGILSRIERRLDTSRSWGRDVDELFQQLNTASNAAWPEDAESSLTLALGTLRLSFAWQARSTQPQRNLRLAAWFAALRLAESIEGVGDGDARFTDEIIAVWSGANVIPRRVLASILLDVASVRLLRSLEEHLTRDHMRLSSDAASLLTVLGNGGAPDPTAARDHALFVARLRSRLNQLPGALRILESEASSDPRVLETWAEVLCEHGRHDEAVDQLSRALVVAPEPVRIRERLFEVAAMNSDFDELVEQGALLLEESGDIMYWHMLADAIAELAPERLAEVRTRLRDRSLGVYVDVLIVEGDVDAVAEASAARTFSYDRLWRMADFLAPHNPTVAAKLYERAITLQGAVAHSRAQCADLGARIEGVIPFFQDIGRPTKPRRLARELIARNKNNVPLKREFERIFEVSF